MLQRCEGGVDAALQYAKTISKYMKDLIGYLEKRTTLGEWGDSRWVPSGAGLSHETGRGPSWGRLTLPGQWEPHSSSS